MAEEGGRLAIEGSKAAAIELQKRCSSPKRSPWHRVHDSFVNTAMTMALEHYALVITEYGSAEQRKHLRRLRHDVELKSH